MREWCAFPLGVYSSSAAWRTCCATSPHVVCRVGRTTKRCHRCRQVTELHKRLAAARCNKCVANDAPCASCERKPLVRAIDANAFVRHPTLRRDLPGGSSEQRKVSGISQCHRCHTTFSRDVNACCNIMAVGIAAAIRTCDIMECRPAYLDSPRCRQYEPDVDMRGEGAKPETAVSATGKRRPGAPAATTSQTRRRRRNGARSGAAVAADAEGSGDEATLTTPAGVDPPSTPAAGTTHHAVAGIATRVAARRRARGKRSRGEEGSQATGRAPKRQRRRCKEGNGAT